MIAYDEDEGDRLHRGTKETLGLMEMLSASIEMVFKWCIFLLKLT